MITSLVAVKVKVGHTKMVKMAKESSEWEFLKKKLLITTGKGLKIYSRQTLSRFDTPRAWTEDLVPRSSMEILNAT